MKKLTSNLLKRFTANNNMPLIFQNVIHFNNMVSPEKENEGNNSKKSTRKEIQNLKNTFEDSNKYHDNQDYSEHDNVIHFNNMVSPEDEKKETTNNTPQDIRKVKNTFKRSNKYDDNQDYSEYDNVINFDHKTGKSYHIKKSTPKSEKEQTPQYSQSILKLLTERELIEIREKQSITPDQFIRLAENYIGAIYDYGSIIGEGYSKKEMLKTDCSGLIYGILKMVGINTTERSTIFQYPISDVLYDPQSDKHNKSIGQKGDLIFWFGKRKEGYYGTTHVAFIEENLGGGAYQTIESASSLGGVTRTIREIDPKKHKIVRYPYIKQKEERIAKITE